MQRESNEAELTNEILATTGEVPQPDAGGLTILAISSYRKFVRNYTTKRPSAVTQNATMTGDNQRAFWESVQAYVDENLNFIKGESLSPK